MTRVCIIGAGPSGFTALKALREAGIETVCFEASDDIGGNWYYNNPNGQSACYQSLHIDTSKTKAGFDDFPMPDDYPDFPSHQQIFQYFQDYVAHFQLRPHIRFNTWVTEVTPESGGWRVVTDQGEAAHFDYVLVANGHHWKPSWPEYPGDFSGETLHAHSYRHPAEPVQMQGKRVLVVGFGNSAMDIASELSPRFLTERLCVSARRGATSCPSTFSASLRIRRCCRPGCRAGWHGDCFAGSTGSLWVTSPVGVFSNRIINLWKLTHRYRGSFCSGWAVATSRCGQRLSGWRGMKWCSATAAKSALMCWFSPPAMTSVFLS
ncbi:NAD(P)-binding domain-containing protein [Ferrimonas balearica]|nr:NAD(P)-binding domain-containing protein [Ferrimonas balearica]